MSIVRDTPSATLNVCVEVWGPAMLATLDTTQFGRSNAIICALFLSHGDDLISNSLGPECG